MRLFPSPGSLGTSDGRRALLLPPFGAGSGSSPAGPFPFDWHLQAFLASATGASVRPLYTPQAASFPCLTYAQTSIKRLHGLSGHQGLSTAVYQITAWALDYNGARALAQSVFNALDSFRGLMPYNGANVLVKSALSDDEIAVYNPPANSSDTGAHQRVCIYSVSFEEPRSTSSGAG